MSSFVLVTGASGFVGKALVKRLSDSGMSVIALDSGCGDISQPETLHPYKHLSIERVFHLAGSTFVPDSWEAPLRFQRTNIMGTGNVAEFCRLTGAALTFVSAYVYGQPLSLPISEDAEPNPNNPYAYTKIIAENVCKFYSDIYSVPVTIIRPFNVYGVGQSKKFLISTIIDQVLNGDAIRVETLEPKRDYIFLDDLIDALELTLRRRELYSIYNIGSGYSLSVKEIIDIIQKEAKTEKEIVSANMYRRNELMDVVADISQARIGLGWMPKTTLTKGVKRILQSNQTAQTKTGSGLWL
jgi:nucleoside-diphosphate-sugar epimerase